MKLLSCVQLFATAWTVAYQAPWSMGFSRQEYWSGLFGATPNGLPFPSPRALPNPGIEPGSPALQTDTLPSEPQPAFRFHLKRNCSICRCRLSVSMGEGNFRIFPCHYLELEAHRSHRAEEYNNQEKNALEAFTGEKNKA